jgi:hypothetical protein
LNIFEIEVVRGVEMVVVLDDVDIEDKYKGVRGFLLISFEYNF